MDIKSEANLAEATAEWFAPSLIGKEREKSTIETYARSVMHFNFFRRGRPVTKELLVEWKRELIRRKYAPGTINGHIAAINAYLDYLGMADLSLRYLSVEKKMFLDTFRQLTKEDFQRLVETAEKENKKRLALVMQTIAETGIRVSELMFITVEAVKAGIADIHMKGKYRQILITSRLRKKLRAYAKENHIRSGEIFLTSTGKRLGRKQIWAEMKALCAKAGVDPRKVFPHNLRHLFACTHYKQHRDLVLLAGLLGHSSIETTRIYTIRSLDEAYRSVEQLNLIS